jgi:hypothetical protein
LGRRWGAVTAFSEPLGAEFELAGDLGKLRLDASPFDTDGVAALLDFRAAEVAVGS